jgi:hypothetical protein
MVVTSGKNDPFPWLFLRIAQTWRGPAIRTSAIPSDGESPSDGSTHLIHHGVKKSQVMG